MGTSVLVGVEGRSFGCPTCASRFGSGQHVTLSDRRDVEATWNGGYRVVEVLTPTRDGLAPRYRVLSTGGAHGRSVDEDQLDPAFQIERAPAPPRTARTYANADLKS